MDIINFILEYQTLKKIPRSGWLTCSVPLAEVKTVALHTLDTAVISMLLADLFKDNGYCIDCEKVLKIALIHDLPETRIGDIALPNKKYFDRKELKRIEENVLSEILSKFDVSPGYLELWKAKGIGVEGEIVSIADLMSVLFEQIELRNRGFENEELDDILEKVMGELLELCEKYEFLNELLMEFRAKFNSI